MLRPFALTLGLFGGMTAAAGAASPDGISVAGWQSILRQLEEEELEVRPAEGGEAGSTWRLTNREQAFEARFASDGVSVAPGGEDPHWSWSLRLMGFGQAGAESRVEPVTPVASGHRIEYRHPGLTEWYVNERRGMEHGFTIPAPIAGNPAGLCLLLALRGTLDASVGREGDGLTLRDRDGTAVLAYSGLHAYDASGRTLVSRMALEPAPAGERRLRIAVDVSGAVYPVVVDPLISTEVEKLTAADGAANDEFGWSVSISGDTLVVGARSDDNGAATDSGSAYVFERNQGGVDNWGQVKKLTAADGAADDRFGWSVSISGDTVIVGARSDESGGANQSGSAYVFERNQGGANNWGQVKKLTASDLATGDRFGVSVSISGDRVVVGAHQDDDAGSNSGSAYLFERNQGGANNWGQIKKLTAADGAANDLFGDFVSISGDTVVVGSLADDDAGTESGSVYVFERNQGGANNWGQVTKLIAADTGAGDNFGGSVSISGDTLAVGARLDDDAGTESGSVYVFERNQGGANNWGQVQKLTAAGGAAGDFFGVSVSISGDTLAVGAYFDDDAGGDSGSAYVFERNQGGANNWGQVQKLTAADAAVSDFFGWSVSISGDTVVVGAYQDDDAGADSGSAYVFERNQGGANNWGQVTKLIAADGAGLDRFGIRVSMSGDTVVVGAYADDDAGTDSGSAYVFERNQGGANSWGQVQKLTAVDAAANDLFGVSVSISGDTVVVGALGDDDAGVDSGSAHVFRFNCPVCGDEIPEPPELCDDGAGNSDVIPDACRTDCTPAGCGDGATDTGEECDDAGETAECDVDCTTVECGDGLWNPTAGEACDDAGASASCDADCTLALCGDGILNPLAGEVCDDGNVFGGDACAADCSAGCDSSDIDKLVAQDGAATNLFGNFLSISGDTVVVGAYQDDGAGSSSGSAYVLERNQGGTDNWGQVKKLTASDGAAGDLFGSFVSISGDTVVVGALGNDDAGMDSGSAYVFARNHGGANNWGQVKKLTAADAAEGERFGHSVSISGDTLVVGADIYGAGSAYVLERNQGGADNWGQVKKLSAAGGGPSDQFGFLVSIHGDTVVVGAPSNEDAGPAAGSAYVFARNQGGPNNWGQVKQLTAVDAGAFDGFGYFVSISADTVVAGAVGDDDAGPDSGSAYVFARNHGGANNWGQVKKLTASDGAAGDGFGHAVSISEDTVVAGALYDDDAGPDSGSAYVFGRDQGGTDNWGQVQKLAAADAAAGDRFGFLVSISGDTIVAGASGDDDAGSESGSAYVFELACPDVPGEASPGADMRASRNGSTVDVIYTAACAATDHAAYVGISPIVGSAQWVASHCGLGVDGTASFDPGSVLAGQFAYFVIVGYDDEDEGSYGQRSGGAERPEAVGVGSCDRPMGPPDCE